MPYLPHRRQLEAAVVQLAAVDLSAASPWMQGGCRPTCRKRTSAAAVALLAASPWMRGGGCSTCCRDGNWRWQTAPYLRHRCLEDADVHLPPRSGCEAAVVIPASMKTTRGRSRCTCCLAVDARRRTTYLFRRRQDAAVDLPAWSKTTGGRSRPTCCLAVDARRLLPTASSLYEFAFFTLSLPTLLRRAFCPL